MDRVNRPLKLLENVHLLRVLSDTREKQNYMAKQQCTVPRIIANFLRHLVLLAFSRAWESYN